MDFELSQVFDYKGVPWPPVVAAGHHEFCVPPAEASGERLREVLKTHGVAVIPGLLDQKRCDALFDGFWSTMEFVSQGWKTPLARNNPKTWGGYSNLFPGHSMLLQHWVGHAQPFWDVRQDPDIVDVFAKLWQVPAKDLLVSFDGVSFHIPPEQRSNRGWARRERFHMDQRLSQTQLQTYQSWVTPLPVEEGDGTLVVLRGSHAHFAEFAKRFGHEFASKTRDYVLLQSYGGKKTDPETRLRQVREKRWIDFFIGKGCEKCYIQCPAGSLVLWDSRTVHMGQEPRMGRLHPKFRAVVYVCYLPRRLATEKELIKKRAAFENGRMTSHWPQRSRLFGKVPVYWIKSSTKEPMTPFPLPKLTDLGKRLAAMDDSTKVRSPLQSPHFV
jgi:hypothetical protein